MRSINLLFTDMWNASLLFADMWSVNLSFSDRRRVVYKNSLVRRLFGNVKRIFFWNLYFRRYAGTVLGDFEYRKNRLSFFCDNLF